MKKQVGVGWTLVGALMGAVFAIAAATMLQRARPQPVTIEPPPPTATPSPTPTPEPTATMTPLRVYVSGAVQAPDVYVLPPNSIAADAVEAAGDFVPEAASQLVNLAQPLSDGMHLYIPTLEEVQNGEQPVLVSPSQLAPDSSVASSDEPASTGPVNINSAGLEQLDTLPGIGPVTAQNIIDHRTTNGPFATIEAIMDVPGIGPGKFEQMKGLITVE
jgi:competence protein ComEA